MKRDIEKAKHFLVTAICLFSLVAEAAFNDTIPEPKKLSIFHLTEGGKQMGYILSTADSSIQFMERKYWKNEVFLQRKIIPAEDINGIVAKAEKKFQ